MKMNQKYLRILLIELIVITVAALNLHAQKDITIKDITPMYSVYVAMSQQGFCGPETNSGWFEKCELEAGFTFQLLTVKEFGSRWGFYREGYPMPQDQIWGEGTISSYSLCPDYDSEAEPNKVTIGPKPFKPSLLLTGTEDVAPVPLEGDTGKHLLIYFQMGSATDGGTIMEWESTIGIGKLGERFDSFAITFSVGWESIMKGEDFEVGATYKDEGEVEEWRMHFIPNNE
jgi:hypothetical protein